MCRMGFGGQFFAFACLASVAGAIFYRGAVDPRLAARKVTVWWLLGAARGFDPLTTLDSTRLTCPQTFL